MLLHARSLSAPDLGGDDTSGVEDPGSPSLECEDADAGAPPHRKLRDSVTKLCNVQRLFTRGVRRRHVKDWLQIIKFNRRLEESEEHTAFMSQVVHSGLLMRQSTLGLRSVSLAASKAAAAGEAGASAESVMSAAAKAMNVLKTSTAHTCWYDFIMPIKQELSELSKSHDMLRCQLREVRRAYLKEITVLREQARFRGDPLANLDIEFFFEPTEMLEPDEYSFFASLLSEKLKMMMEHNPKVVKAFDFGQLQRLLEKAENHEISKLKRALKKMSDELREAKEANRVATSGESRASASALPIKANLYVEALEMQQEELRVEVRSKQHAVRKAEERAEAVKTERDEFYVAWKEESNEKLRQRKELEQLESHCRTLEAELAAAGEAIRGLEARVLTEVKVRVTRAGRARGAEPGSTGETEDVETEAVVSSASASGKTSPDAASADVPEQPPLQPMEAEASPGSASPAQQLDELRVANTALETRCHELEDLLRNAVESFRKYKAGTSMEEADALAEYAKDLGCSTCDRVSNGVRVCVCGNLLLEDSIYCRKCGSEWTEEHETLLKEDVKTLTSQLEWLDQEHKKAVEDLNAKLRGSSTPAPGGSLPSEMGRDDGAWATEVAEAEQEVFRLSNAKQRAEAQVLVALAESAESADAPGVHEEQLCSCDSGQKLRFTCRLLARVQELCSKMAGKLKGVVVENMRLSTMLASSRSTMDGAIRSLRESMQASGCTDHRLLQSLRAVEQSNNYTVFQRLWIDAVRRGRRDSRVEHASQTLASMRAASRAVGGLSIVALEEPRPSAAEEEPERPPSQGSLPDERPAPEPPEAPEVAPAGMQTCLQVVPLRRASVDGSAPRRESVALPLARRGPPAPSPSPSRRESLVPSPSRPGSAGPSPPPFPRRASTGVVLPRSRLQGRLLTETAPATPSGEAGKRSPRLQGRLLTETAPATPSGEAGKRSPRLGSKRVSDAGLADAPLPVFPMRSPGGAPLRRRASMLAKPATVIPVEAEPLPALELGPCKVATPAAASQPGAEQEPASDS